MKRTSYFCAGWWPFLIVPLLLLLLFIILKWRSIEESISAETEHALETNNHAWALVKTDDRGRDVLLKGKAPSNLARDEALKIAMQVNGVRVVDFDGTIASPPLTPTTPEPTPTPSQEKPISKLPSELSIVLSDNNELTLAGFVKDLDSQRSIVSIANKVFPQHKIINELVIMNNRDNISFADELMSLTTLLGSNGKIYVSGNELTVTGEVENKDASDNVESKLRAFFDGDINNQLDIKKAEEQTLPVTKERCETIIEDLLESKTILFETDSAQIKDSSLNTVEEILAIVRRCPDASFEVIGHTDSSGDPQSNLILSTSRAMSIIDLLADFGVDKSRFEAVGMGAEQPVASNSTKMGRAQNRRIEFKLKD